MEPYEVTLSLWLLTSIQQRSLGSDMVAHVLNQALRKLKEEDCKFLTSKTLSQRTNERKIPQNFQNLGLERLLTVKTTGCSFRVPGSDSQLSSSCSLVSVTPGPGDPTPSSGLLRQQPSLWCTDMQPKHKSFYQNFF